MILPPMLFRIFGSGAIARFRSVWNAENRIQGSSVVKLKPKRYGRKHSSASGRMPGGPERG